MRKKENPELAGTVKGVMGEMAFRSAAGLCWECGMHPAMDDGLLCVYCREEQESVAMQKQWREWGIAA